MRFEVSRVLDAIELRLSLDPMVARVVVDLVEVLRYSDVDRGRPASLLRLGQVIDAFARAVGEEGVAVYTVADRGVLGDGDLTSNERMVIRRWADDGLVEVLPNAGDRVLEVADLTGLPVITRRDPRRHSSSYPWLLAAPGRALVPMAGDGGIVLRGGAVAPPPSTLDHPVMTRRWRCPEQDCATFGPAREVGQPAPRLRAGVPVCPRHDQPLANAGARPASVALGLRVDGVVVHRFAVAAGNPVVVGREPAEPGGVRLGPWLSDAAMREISRSHLVVAVTPAGVEITDTSTNGTVVASGNGPDELLRRGASRLLEERDVIRLHHGIELARATRWRSGGAAAPGSVMAEAPTVALRMPPP